MVTHELDFDRRIAREAVEGLGLDYAAYAFSPLTRNGRIKEIEQISLDDCNVFALLVAKTMTPLVESEFDRACQLGMARCVFARHDERHSDELSRFLKRCNCSVVEYTLKPETLTQCLTTYLTLQRSEGPSVLLQALVLPGPRMRDGTEIEAVKPAWFEIVRLLKQDPGILYRIDHRKMEELIAAAYKQEGWEEVILTPRSGDLGRDIIASRSDWGRVRFIDQVKAYKPGHLVTAEEVRALSFVLMSDQGATKGLITTTSDFAPMIKVDPLIKPHLPYRIELVNGTKLVERLGKLSTG
jgi:restriction system protein